MYHFSDARRRTSILLASCLLVACSGEPRRGTARQPLSFAFDTWAGYYPAAAAVGSGIYDSLGIDVTLRRPENTKGLMADFAAGRHDLIGVSLAELVILASNAPDVRVVLCSDESAGADALVARDARSIAALRGKRIGVNLGSFSEVFVARILESHGIPRQAVDLIDVDATEVPARLADRSIDAGETWEPYITRAASQGAHTLATTADVPGLIVDCIATRESVLAQRRDAVRAFVTGWFAGLERWRGDSIGMRPVIARSLGLPESEISAVGIRLLDAAENRRRLAPDAPLSFPSVAETYASYFASTGFTRAPIVSKMLFNAAMVP